MWVQGREVINKYLNPQTEINRTLVICCTCGPATECLRKLLYISYLEFKTSNWVWSKINYLVGPQEPLLATVRRQKLSRFRRVMSNDSLSENHPSGQTYRVGEARVSRGNAGWMMSKSEHPCPCQNCQQCLAQKRLEEDLC